MRSRLPLPRTRTTAAARSRSPRLSDTSSDTRSPEEYAISSKARSRRAAIDSPSRPSSACWRIGAGIGRGVRCGSRGLRRPPAGSEGRTPRRAQKRENVRQAESARATLRADCPASVFLRIAASISARVHWGAATGLPGPAAESSTAPMSRAYADTVCAEARREADSSIRNCSSVSRTDRLRRELQPALEAAQHEPFLLGLLLDQERGLAARARHRPRLVPRSEGALRISIAAVEDLAALGPSLRQLALAALRARDAERDGARVLAVGPPRASDEPSVGAVAHHQRRAAQLARALDGNRQLRIVHRARELALRIARACQERPATAELLHQHAPAVGASDVGG